MYIKLPVSGHSATDKTPMYEMPRIFVFGGWGFGVGESIFCIGVLGVGILSLAFCPIYHLHKWVHDSQNFILLMQYSLRHKKWAPMIGLMVRV